MCSNCRGGYDRIFSYTAPVNDTTSEKVPSLSLQTCGSTSQFPDYYAQDDRPHLLFNLASDSQVWRILSDLRDANHDKADPEQAVADQDMCKALFQRDQATGRVRLPVKEEEVMECMVPEARAYAGKKGTVLLIKPPHLVSTYLMICQSLVVSYCSKMVKEPASPRTTGGHFRHETFMRESQGFVMAVVMLLPD